MPNRYVSNEERLKIVKALDFYISDYETDNNPLDDFKELREKMYKNATKLIDKTVCVYGKNGERFCQTYHKFYKKELALENTRQLFRAEYGKKVMVDRIEIVENRA